MFVISVKATAVRCILLFLILCVLESVTVASNCTAITSTAEPSLKSIAILHRHGLRNPLKTWPTDVYNDEKKYWPLGWGQLRAKGKQQLYKLGRTMRQRYKRFIPNYSADTVIVKSSDLDRCLMSAAALLAGWFPPYRQQRWNRNLNWQPIPIHSVPYYEDRMIALKAPCPKFRLEKKKVDMEIKLNETMTDRIMYKYFSEHLGEMISNCGDLEFYYTTMQIEEIVGYKLPDWTKLIYPTQLQEKATLSIESFTQTRYMQRMYGGPLIKEMLHHFQLKSADDAHKPNVLIYSGHDLTLISVLRALQFNEHIWPYYGSAVIFELHKPENEPFHIKLLYMNDSSQTTPYELNVPGCGRPCSLMNFLELTEYVRSVDWDKDCEID